MATIAPAYPKAFRNLSGVPQSVTAAAGVLFGLQIENTQNAEAWVQVFNKVQPQIGTDKPDKEFRVGANSSLRSSFQPQGVTFSAAITIASTTTEAGGVGSNPGVQVFVDYL